MKQQIVTGGWQETLWFIIEPIASGWVGLAAIAAIGAAITIKTILSATIPEASETKERWAAVKSAVFVLCGLVAGLVLWWSGEAVAGVIPVMAFCLGPAWMVVMYLADRFAPELADYVRCKADFKYRCD